MVNCQQAENKNYIIYNFDAQISTKTVQKCKNIFISAILSSFNKKKQQLLANSFV